MSTGAAAVPYSWRVLLALEYKRLPYTSHLLQFSKQEHKSPQMLALNFRGRVPVLKDGDYVVFESLAVLYYLDRKYPDPPLFGRTPEEAGVIMRVICEYQAYTEEHADEDRATLSSSAKPANRSDELAECDARRGERGALHRSAAVEVRLGRRRDRSPLPTS